MGFTLLILCMYLKLPILLPNCEVDNKKVEISSVGNSKTLPIPCPYETPLADRISKECLTNATTEKLQENKLKLYKNLKSMKL